MPVPELEKVEVFSRKTLVSGYEFPGSLYNGYSAQGQPGCPLSHRPQAPKSSVWTLSRPATGLQVQALDEYRPNRQEHGRQGVQVAEVSEI